MASKYNRNCDSLLPNMHDCFRSADVSPDGRYAALLWHSGEDRVDAYGCPFDLKSG